MIRLARISLLMLLFIIIAGCSGNGVVDEETSCIYARYFNVIDVTQDGELCRAIELISPYNNKRDTLVVKPPLKNVVCMSSSQVAGLAAVGADSIISAVSGLRYITNQNLRLRSENLTETNPVYVTEIFRTESSTTRLHCVQNDRI